MKTKYKAVLNPGIGSHVWDDDQPHYVLLATPDAYTEQVEAMAASIYVPRSWDSIAERNKELVREQMRTTLAAIGIKRPAAPQKL